MSIPVVLFCFKRPKHTERTLIALEANHLAQETPLFVFVDGPRKTEEVELVDQVKHIAQRDWNFAKVTVIVRTDNWGLGKNIIDGVSHILSQYEQVIVLEDDLLTSPLFLTYMHQALAHYAKEPKVYSISGFSYPPHLMPLPGHYPYDTWFNVRSTSWGWGTWRDRWQSVEWELDTEELRTFFNDKEAQKRFNRGGEDMSRMLKDQLEGKINSWAIRWCYHQFKQEGLALFPKFSYVHNIGNDGSGTHTDRNDNLVNDLAQAPSQPTFPPTVEVDPKVLKAYRKVKQAPLRRRIVRTLRSMV